MGKIVYHGTIEGEAPHVHGYPFHAGTLNAAQSRLDDEIENGVDWDPMGTGKPEIGVGQIHAYEISDDAPTSKRVWEDPYLETEKSVPEHKQNRVYPYTNTYEDKGSTSYVIPSEFVGKNVKHLGVQFQHLINTSDSEEQAIYKGITAMSGGKFK